MSDLNSPPIWFGLLTARVLIMINSEFFPASSGPSFEIWMQNWSAKLFRSNWSQERYNYSEFLYFRLFHDTGSVSIILNDFEPLMTAYIISYSSGLLFRRWTTAYDINHRWNGHEPRDKLITCLKIKKDRCAFNRVIHNGSLTNVSITFKLFWVFIKMQLLVQ